MLGVVGLAAGDIVWDKVEFVIARSGFDEELITLLSIELLSSTVPLVTIA